jgi:hypothetical protein
MFDEILFYFLQKKTFVDVVAPLNWKNLATRRNIIK